MKVGTKLHKFHHEVLNDARKKYKHPLALNKLHNVQRRVGTLMIHYLPNIRQDTVEDIQLNPLLINVLEHMLNRNLVLGQHRFHMSRDMTNIYLLGSQNFLVDIARHKHHPIDNVYRQYIGSVLFHNNLENRIRDHIRA